MERSARRRNRPTFSYPLYFLAGLAVLMVLLVTNGIFEIRRTRAQLFHILEAEALVAVKGIERNLVRKTVFWSKDFPSSSTTEATELTEELLDLEDLIIEEMVNQALELDRSGNETAGMVKEGSPYGRVFFLTPEAHPGPSQILSEPLRRGRPFFLSVMTGASRLAVFRGEGAARSQVPLAVAVGRRWGKGIILIALNPEAYRQLTQRIAVQEVLGDFVDKGNIVYLQVENETGQVLARAETKGLSAAPSEVGRRPIRAGDQGVFWVRTSTGEALEVIRPLQPGGKTLGGVRVGLSFKEAQPILDRSRRNIFFLGSILFLAGLIGLFVIFRVQDRHLKKLKELEEQIRLKEELSAMGQLAAGVAHEIKNPLNAISMVVQRLEREFPPTDSQQREEYQRFTRMVRGEINRVNRILSDFLLMARPLEGRKESQDLAEILEYCLGVIELEMKERGINLEREIAAPLPPIPCDRFQLTQAFLNILLNAVESMAEGGRLRLTAREVGGRESGGSGEKKALSKLMKPPAETPRGFLEVTVTDTGKGISPENLKKVFAPYFTTKGKGLGLGLAITERMLRAHNGEMEIQSAEGRGTTVIVRLPLPDTET